MRLIFAWSRRLTLLLLLAIAAAGCDKFGDVTSGVGGAAKSLGDKISGDKPSEKDESTAEAGAGSQSASGSISRSEPDTAEESADAASMDDKSEDKDSGGEEDSAAEPETTDTGERAGDFSLIFEMSYQSCSSCGIWFDSAELVIAHSKGRFTAQQSGSLLIKEAPYFQGRFKADIRSIPPTAKIRSATLYMHLNRHEGISNDDYTSSISVYGDIGGSTRFVREITARDDIKGKGYSKANPVVPVDFTEFARQL